MSLDVSVMEEHMLVERLFAAAPFTILGHTSAGPVYAFAGAAEDVETEIEVELDEEAGQGEGGESGAGTQDEEPDEEKARLREALKKANAEARTYRLKLREAQKKATETAVEEVEEEAADKGTELTPAQLKRAVDKATKTATEAAEAKYRKVAISSAAEAAFVKAGAKASTTDKLVRLLDLDDIDIDSDTGRIVGGLDEQIDSLKAEFPELFAPAEPAKPARRPVAKRAAAAPRQEAEPAALSSAEKIAAQLLGAR
jgi:hypothetical protein